MIRSRSVALVLAALALPSLAIAQRTGKLDTRADVETKIRAKFAGIDANKDGFVTRDEAVGMSAAAAGNGTGSMRRQDELKGEGSGQARARPTERRNLDGLVMLRVADANKDGRVSVKEAVDGSLAMFDRADTNGDGVLSDAERTAARPLLREQIRRMRAN